MGFFGCVTLCGVSDSAVVACGMFMLHMSVLTVLIIWSFAFGIQNNFQIYRDNIQVPFPVVKSTNGNVLSHRNPVGALFFGYCSALLGITGFETAANYVEQMKSSKTFMRTIDWLWYVPSDCEFGAYNV
jgi:amino acid transporter